MHYVSPSVWAWRQKRVLKIREACDLMLTLFPFEARFYDDHQVPVRFVGHPLADTIPLCADRAAARLALGLPEQGMIVALMPGSRGGEVARLGELFLSAAERLRAMRPGIRFVMPCASPERRLELEQMLATRDLPLTLLDGRSHEALAACNAVLIASGTATLEALLFKRPMVVAYSVAPMTYRILRRLVKSPTLRCPICWRSACWCRSCCRTRRHRRRWPRRYRRCWTMAKCRRKASTASIARCAAMRRARLRTRFCGW